MEEEDVYIVTAVISITFGHASSLRGSGMVAENSDVFLLTGIFLGVIYTVLIMAEAVLKGVIE